MSESLSSIQAQGGLAAAQNIEAMGNAGAVDTSNAAGQARVSSMDQLQKEHPEFFEMIMKSIATTVCQQMKRSNERVIQRMKEGEQR